MENEPQNEKEALFIRGLPYYAPRTAKTIAFALDNGMTKKDLEKKMKNPSETEKSLFDNFVDFYLAEPERAKELFQPYSGADLDGYRF